MPMTPKQMIRLLEQNGFVSDPLREMERQWFCW